MCCLIERLIEVDVLNRDLTAIAFTHSYDSSLVLILPLFDANLIHVFEICI